MGIRFIVLFLVAFAACMPIPVDGSIPFQTIEKKNDGAYIGQQQYAALEPGLMVIASPEDVDALGVWFGERARDRLRQVNFTRNVALAVFQGWQFTGGYGIEVERVQQQGNSITVYAISTTPAPEDNPSPTVTSPYHLVLVRGVSVLDTSVEFRYLLDGETVLEMPTPIP